MNINAVVSMIVWMLVMILAGVEGGFILRGRTECNNVVCPKGTHCVVDPGCTSSVCGTFCKRGNEERSQPKPGKCPKFNIRMLLFANFAKCDNKCMYDEDCPGNRKCCFSGCSKTCQPPFIPVRSMHLDICPPTWMIKEKVFCGEACFDDSECAIGQKCCSNGCGRQCMEMFAMM